IHMLTRWAKDVNPNTTHNEYPRPRMVRKNWQNLNGLWEYAITDALQNKPSKFEDKILVPYPIESALSGVKKAITPDQFLWYKRTFQKPVMKVGEKLLLHFEAVDWRATVVVNGKEIGEHSGGYTGFSFDITHQLKAGNNELLVKVYDPTDRGIGPHGKQVLNPASIYYTPSSGIWQTVWLEVVPEVSIQSLKITPDIDRELLNLTVDIDGDKDEHDTSEYYIHVFVNNELKGKGYDENDLDNKLTVPVKTPHLWNPDDPYLYDLKVRLYRSGRLVDEVKSYFGMRKVEIKKDSVGVDRIFLNNKYTYNLGVLDQGFWPEGLYTAPTDEALAFDIKAIKAMGFNTIRKHIKVEPARWYYHADKIGMMVWQDFVNPNQGLPEGAREQFEKEIKETIDQLQNYPCITTWVLFNERWGAYDQKRLTEWVKHYDPSRLVNGHSGELLYVDEQLREPSDSAYISSDMADVHSYPDPMNALKQEGKARVLGEFGGIGVSVPYHQWNDLQGWGYVQVSAAELKGKYAIMVKRLQKFEKEGLSASIYTQPFDVEGEENGLMTYDREILKIPLQEIRKMHQSLAKQAKPSPNDLKFYIGKNVDTGDNDSRYSEFIKMYEKGKRDSAFLRRLTLMALRLKDQSRATQVGNSYIGILKQPFSIENLTYIKNTARTSKDTGFRMFLRDSIKVDRIFGKNSCGGLVQQIIVKEEIDPFWSYQSSSQLQKQGSSPDWNSIEQRILSKYETIGEEVLLGKKMEYYLRMNQWDSMARYYVLYFARALDHSFYSINDVTWVLFEHIDDTKVLNFAAEVQKYNIENFDKTGHAYDTYANILYKLGRNQEALQWQEKAVATAPNSKGIAANFEKMKKGEKTWPEE
ncbi:MAG TPA: glycoside hydrolase family 2 TIM barrel-domain containing protein, partial [Flavitalea sp.]|nr:glycoside hydrolase family 2 TIM barrel-domain containing protein [Flavitalea sp.]